MKSLLKKVALFVMLCAPLAMNAQPAATDLAGKAPAVPMADLAWIAFGAAALVVFMKTSRKRAKA